MEKDLYIRAINLVEALFNKCDARLKGYCYTESRKDIYLSMPDVLRELFIAALNKHLNISDPFSNDERNTYRGIKIIPNHEMSIVLYHKDYPKMKESWMIYKVWLEAPKSNITGFVTVVATTA